MSTALKLVPVMVAHGALAALAMLAIALHATRADAAPHCDKGFQVVAGQELATPYCQDEYLAAVARTYGLKASSDELRSNPNAKRDICRFVGGDIRVSGICPNDGRRGRY